MSMAIWYHTPANEAMVYTNLQKPSISNIDTTIINHTL
jgi:hypothetical protein